MLINLNASLVTTYSQSGGGISGDNSANSSELGKNFSSFS